MINLTTKKKLSGGSFSTYYRVSRARGLKVLKGSYRSLQAAYNSYGFQMAKEESDLLEIAAYSGVTPECFGVRVARSGSRYRVGILMQHLGNKRLSDLNLSCAKMSAIYDKLDYELSHAGIDHNDLHLDNIMFHKGKFYAIDFSPEVTTVNDSN